VASALSDRLLRVLASFLTEKNSVDKVAVRRLLQLGLIQEREQGYTPTKLGFEKLTAAVEQRAYAQPIPTDDELADEFIIGGGTLGLLPLGSTRLREAQAALVRVLRRGSPPRRVLWGLAGLLDPEHQSQSRRLVLQRRRGGKKEPNYSREIAIVMDIVSETPTGRHGERAAAIRSAMERYGVDEQIVERALEKHETVWRSAAEKINLK
jgi:hypothetical protein